MDRNVIIIPKTNNIRKYDNIPIKCPQSPSRSIYVAYVIVIPDCEFDVIVIYLAYKYLWFMRRKQTLARVCTANTWNTKILQALLVAVDESHIACSGISAALFNEESVCNTKIIPVSPSNTARACLKGVNATI